MELDDPTALALLAAEAPSRARIEHALYGGLLLAAYGEARETRDAEPRGDRQRAEQRTAAARDQQRRRERGERLLALGRRFEGESQLDGRGSRRGRLVGGRRVAPA